MLKQIALSLAVAGLSAPALALTTGDIAFTSFNADEDGFSLVTFVDITAGSTVYFSDNEWNGSAFNTGEGYFTWNTGAAAIAAGTVVRFSAVDTAARGVTAGTLVGVGDNGINATAETIYAYLGTGTTAPTTFLAGVSTEGATNLTPAGLVGGTSAVILTASTDYAQYVGPRSGETSFGAYGPLVNNAAEWAIIVGGDNATAVPNAAAFTTAPIPEPSTYALFGAGLLGIGFGLRSRRGR